MTEKYEVIKCHCMVRKGNNIYSLNTIIDLLNEQDTRIKRLEETIDTIAKDYEVSHGMDIRNAEWFTAW